MMPVYEYRCEDCGHRFEKLVFSISRAPDKVQCPVCQGEQVRRLISAPIVHGGRETSPSADAQEPSTRKPPVFGRKELQEALRKKDK